METSVLVAVTTCVFIIYFIKWIFSRKNLPPGPIVSFPVLGYIPFLSNKPYLDFQRLAKKYGNVFSLRLGTANIVVLNDFESTKDAFAQDEFMGRPQEFPIDLNKETLDTEAMTGLPWKHQRRFSIHMLKDLGLGKSMMEVHIQEEINNFLEQLDQNVGTTFSVRDLLVSSMSNNIGSLIFGKRFKYDDPVRKMLTKVVTDIGTYGGQTSFHLFFPWVKKILRFLNISYLEKAIIVQRGLRDYINKEITEHEKTLNSSDIRDFIDGYLIEIEKRNEEAFCKPVLQDMLNAFFVAGSETVRLSIEWLLLTVAVHQDAQRQIQHEIDEIIGQNQPPVWKHEKSMPYTQAVIMELNRWRTVIPINILRCALADGKVKGHFIPKGSYILSNIWAIHHNPEYWGPDAEEFKPERFLSGDGKHIKKPEHYTPFSIGKRSCPGETFARIEVFLYFTSILQRFNLSLPDGKVADLEGELGLGLMPKPYDLVFTRRN